MKRRRILLIPFGLLVVIILAFFLQDVTRRAIVTPLAYLLWVLNLGYAAIPQLFQWIFLLAVLILIVLTGLLSGNSTGKKVAQPSKPAQGAVEILAGWVSKAGKGNYYKWMIANRLGKLSREMHVRLEERRLPARPEGQDSHARLPPEAVQRYLQAGLDKSFVDYPLPVLPFIHRKATPFDLNVEQAVEFLESQTEEPSGK